MRFGVSNTTPTSPPVAANPFLTARDEFETVFSRAAQRTRNWQLVAFASLGMLGLRLVQDGYVTLTTRVVPYVVEVDRFGRAQAFGPAEPLKTTDRRVMIAQLARWIRDLRGVLPDPAAQAEVMRGAYAMVDPGAAAMLNAYFTDPGNDPRALGRVLMRRVDVTSVLPLPGSQTWRVQWTETETPRQNGSALSFAPRVTAWEGLFTTRVAPPKDTATLELNPLGLYITAITWTRVGSTAADSVTPRPGTISSTSIPSSTP